jgi:hypothetical protein
VYVVPLNASVVPAARAMCTALSRRSNVTIRLLPTYAREVPEEAMPKGSARVGSAADSCKILPLIQYALDTGNSQGTVIIAVTDSQLVETCDRGRPARPRPAIVLARNWDDRPATAAYDARAVAVASTYGLGQGTALNRRMATLGQIEIDRAHFGLSPTFDVFAKSLTTYLRPIVSASDLDRRAAIDRCPFAFDVSRRMGEAAVREYGCRPDPERGYVANEKSSGK